MLNEGTPAPHSVDVVVSSGMPGEFKLAGAVVGVDRANDLAVLRVNPGGVQLPEPLQVTPAAKMMETQKVYIFGFPHGASLGKNITVSESSVSSLRLDDAGTLNQVQVNGGMHPGNSGGPLTDSNGNVVAVAVAGIRGTQINFAIPGEFVKQVLDGHVVSRDFGTPYSGAGGAFIPGKMVILDPMKQVREVKLEIWAGNPGRSRPASATQPASLPGDSARTSGTAKVARDGSFVVETPLPTLGI